MDFSSIFDGSGFFVGGVHDRNLMESKRFAFDQLHHVVPCVCTHCAPTTVISAQAVPKNPAKEGWNKVVCRFIVAALSW